jgi:hypothetical protein
MNQASDCLYWLGIRFPIFDENDSLTMYQMISLSLNRDTEYIHQSFALKWKT